MAFKTDSLTITATAISSSDAVNKHYVDTTVVINSSTSNEMRFDRPMGYVYGTTLAPLTGAITMSASSAIVGVVSLAIHGPDTSTGVDLPVSFKHMGGTYDGSVNNYIYVQYLDPSNQVYTINKIF